MQYIISLVEEYFCVCEDFLSSCIYCSTKSTKSIYNLALLIDNDHNLKGLC